MLYRSRLTYRDAEAVGHGATDHAAVEAALATRRDIRNARPQDVALVMFHVYQEHDNDVGHVAYATTLGQYNVNTN